MAVAYGWLADGSEASSSGGGYTTTLTPVLPGGTPVAEGDVMFLWAKGQHSVVAQTWTPPSGWTEMGGPLSVDDGNVGGRRYASLQVWVRTAGASESNPTVTVATGGSSGGSLRNWSTNVFVYRPVGGSPRYGLIVPCVDDTSAAATSYTPPSLTSPKEATAVAFIAQAAVSGTLTLASAAGFTSQTASSSDPANRILDKSVTAGSVTMPTLSSGFSRPWMSKTFAFDRLPDSGWSVGFVKF